MAVAPAPLEARGDRLLAEFRRRPGTSARAVLVTVFGDAVEPHGGQVWTGSLVRLVAPLGINERLVRTSLTRLVREGVLAGVRTGRRSFYAVTAAARHEFRSAEHRIYHRAPGAWDGRWTIVVEADGLAPATRAALRERLGWLGFGTLAPPVHVSPVDRTADLRGLFGELGVDGHVAVFRGRAPEAVGLPDRSLMAATAADLDALRPAWEAFLRRFGPVADAVEADGPLRPETAFGLRTLVVHEYRRIVLREPELPAELWPPGWVGDRAYEVAARCYRAFLDAAEAHLDAVAETPAGPLPPAGAGYAARFRPPPPTRRVPAAPATGRRTAPGR